MLKEYDEYQESQLPWVEKIPSHWHWLRNGYLLKEHKDKVGELNIVFNEGGNDWLGINLNFNIIADDQASPRAPLGLPIWVDGEVDPENLPPYPQ